MTLNDIAKKIGIVKYDLLPDRMHAYYPIPEDRKAELCSLELIDRLQTKFNFFQDLYENAKSAWIELCQDENKKAYVDAAGLFMIDHDYDLVTKIKTPEFDGTPAMDFFSLFIHLPSIEAAYDAYLKRGFDEETAKLYMTSYYNCLAGAVKSVPGRPALTRTFFNWQCRYTKTRLFRFGGFNFEMYRHKAAYILKNKKTGQLVPLSCEQKLSETGNIFGCPGHENEAGAYLATFEETADSYIGFPAQDGLYTNQKTVFSKEEWLLAMAPGDMCISVHIPRDTDISPNALKSALEGAKKIAKEGYQDWSPKMFMCSSWLLSMELVQMLKPESKILAFANCYTRYPISSKGRDVFSFVFPKTFNGPYEDLPEDTSLMRALKKFYLDGKFVLNYGGVIDF